MFLCVRCTITDSQDSSLFFKFISLMMASYEAISFLKSCFRNHGWSGIFFFQLYFRDYKHLYHVLVFHLISSMGSVTTFSQFSFPIAPRLNLALNQ